MKQNEKGPGPLLMRLGSIAGLAVAMAACTAPVGPEDAVRDFIPLKEGVIAVPFDRAVSNIKRGAEWCWGIGTASSWISQATPGTFTIMIGIRGADVLRVIDMTPASGGMLQFSVRGKRHALRAGDTTEHVYLDSWANGRCLQDCLNARFTPEEIKAGEEAKAKSYKP